MRLSCEWRVPGRGEAGRAVDPGIEERGDGKTADGAEDAAAANARSRRRRDEKTADSAEDTAAATAAGEVRIYNSCIFGIGQNGGGTPPKRKEGAAAGGRTA